MNNTPIYLNTASCGLVAPESLDAANAVYAALATNSSTRAEEWRAHEEGHIRQVIADFIGASAANVAMVPNFSWAINGVVQSLKGTERVLLYTGDYPSFLEPWKINRFPITWVGATDGFTIDMEALTTAITGGRVDIVALSHVQWSSGYLLDIAAIGKLCRQHGVLFMVDATQSLGANEIDLAALEIDVFAASNYKWMNAGFGTGILYVSDNFLQRYQPVVGGHNSFKMADGEWKYVPSTLSYEPGHPNMYGLTVLEAAIQHKNKLGVGNIAAHNRRLTEQFLAGIGDTRVRILGDHSMTNRCSMVYLVDEHGLGDHIKKHNIVVTQRNGFLRVSMHYYNTEQDVKALVECIKAAPGNQ